MSPPLIRRSFDHPPQYRNYKIVYRRYAGLFFCVCVDANDNELAYLEAIHLFVEVLGEPTKRIARVSFGRGLKGTAFTQSISPSIWPLLRYDGMAFPFVSP